MKKIYLILAPGFELIEATIPIDILKRAGFEVKTISIADDILVTASSGDSIKADILLSSDSDYQDGDLLYLPGGFPGYENIAKNERVKKLAKEYLDNPNKYLAAICGAPSALLDWELISGRVITCHDSVKDKLAKDCLILEHGTITDGNLITAAGAGVAMELAFYLVKILAGDEKLSEIKKSIHYS